MDQGFTPAQQAVMGHHHANVARLAGNALGVSDRLSTALPESVPESFRDDYKRALMQVINAGALSVADVSVLAGIASGMQAVREAVEERREQTASIEQRQEVPRGWLGEEMAGIARSMELQQIEPRTADDMNALGAKLGFGTPAVAKRILDARAARSSDAQSDEGSAKTHMAPRLHAPL